MAQIYYYKALHEKIVGNNTSAGKGLINIVEKIFVYV